MPRIPLAYIWSPEVDYLIISRKSYIFKLKRKIQNTKSAIKHFEQLSSENPEDHWYPIVIEEYKLSLQCFEKQASILLA